MKHADEVLEFRRKTAHLTVGVSIAFLVWKNMLSPLLFGAICFAALGASLLLKQRQQKPSWIYRMLHLVERQKHIDAFPGKSGVSLLFGCFLSAVIFPRDIAVASIIILSFGDALSNLIGHHFGRIITPLHTVKKIEGPLLAGLIAGGIAGFFVPVQLALIASLCAMILEIPEWKIGSTHVDDNIIIPLVSGGVLFLLM